MAYGHLRRASSRHKDRPPATKSRDSQRGRARGSLERGQMT